MLSRRTLLAAAALPLAARLLEPRAARAQAAGPYTLPPLPYAPEANEPHIDALTMTIHHDRHHAAYVANLNAAIKDTPQLAALPIEQLMARLAEVPDGIRTAVRNNGGGHLNHSLFWQIMGGKGGAPAGALAEAVTRDFGGLEAMQGAFNRAGAGQFGSGWVFLTVDGTGKLAIVARPNQDTPYSEGGKALLCNDVWEHAYYLKYQNRRPDYLAAWWNVVDWEKVGARYAAAKAGTLTL